jgi:diguanylate cyclase (GGDEF)-like protein
MFDEIHTLFQPVVELKTGEPFAYEALSRGPSDEGLFDPRSLFIAAVEQGRLVELDVRCMDLAIARAVEHGLLRAGSPALFVNTLPDTVQAPGFTKRLERMLDRTGAPPSGLILEVNEAWRIQGFDHLREVAADLRSLGVRTAVDGAGSGHSGLQTLAELRPEYVKLDKTLIRGVQRDPARSAILEMFVILADRLSVELVAEGVEYPGELGVINRLNIHYAQGYLIGHPGPELEVEPDWPEVHGRLIHGAAPTRTWSTAGPIGALADEVPTAQVDTPVREVVGMFEEDNPPDSLVVLEGERLVGLVTRERLFKALAHQYGHALYMRSRIEVLADTNATVAEFSDPVESVAREAMDREDVAIYDDVIVTLDDRLYGTVKVRQMLTSLSSKQVEVARHANPLSGLPGNAVIEQETRRRLAAGGDVAFIHVDLDNFKAFNDRYGFRHGDDAIRTLAAVLEDIAAEHGNGDIFVGHVGGDDFALVLDLPLLGPIGRAIVERFDREARALHSPEDLERGYYVATSRTGEEIEHPLLTVTVSAAVSPANRTRHYLELTEAVAETKQYAKQRTEPGSCFFVDRRHGSDMPVPAGDPVESSRRDSSEPSEPERAV